MALLFMDGFDDDLQAGKWDNFAETLTTTNARSGNAVLINNNGNNSIQKIVTSATDTMICGGWMMWTGGGQSIGGIHFIEDGVTTHLNIRHQSVASNALSVYRGAPAGTLLGTTSAFNDDTPAYYEFKVVIHDSAGTVEIRRQGEVILSLTSQDTQNGGSAVCDSVGLGSNSGSPMYCDDFYMADETGSVANDFLGDSKVVTRFPDSDSTPLDWTRSAEASNYLTVDEDPPDGVAWNASNSTGQIDMYGWPNLTDGNDIYGVQIGGWAFKDATGNRFYKLRAISDASTEEGPSVALSTTASGTAYMVDLDPDGGGQWTEAQLNAAFFGVEVSTG